MTAASHQAVAPDFFGGARRGVSGVAEARRSRIGDMWAFVVPVLLPIESTAGGQLFLSEVVLLVALPFLLAHARRRGVSRVSHTAMTLGGLWLFGLVFSDIYRGTTFHDYSRGWANVVFVLIDFASLALLIDDRWRRVTLFAAGLAVGQVLQFYVNPVSFAAGDPWKFGYGSAVTLAGVLLASRPGVYRRPVVATGIVIALGVINIKMGFRSLGGICFLTAVMAVLGARAAHAIRPNRSGLKTLATLAVSVLAGIAIVSAYGYAAGHGLLGARAQQKYVAEDGSYGPVIGGRPEIIASVMAIRDSPIVGHGSWASDPKYFADVERILQQAGYKRNPTDIFGGLIPTHSYLFQSWVYGGILGGVFWLWVLARAAGVLPRLSRLADGRLILVAFVDLLFLWAVLFSPLGAEARLTAAFSLVVVLMAGKATLAAAGSTETS